jgi:hypothetical protein
MNHCSGCGKENPTTEEGYTSCCNQRTCDGQDNDTWISHDNKHTVTGCCGYTAGIKFDALKVTRFSKKF